jgi:hypothetical protein
MGRRIAGEGEHPFPAPDRRKVRLGRPGPQRGPGFCCLGYLIKCGWLSLDGRRSGQQLFATVAHRVRNVPGQLREHLVLTMDSQACFRQALSVATI